MTKYYYNGKLVRTSKSDREYKYALMGTSKCYMCSEKYEYCLRRLEYMTKAETLAKQYGKTIDEIWNGHYGIWSDQLYSKEKLHIVELQKGEK